MSIDPFETVLRSLGPPADAADVGDDVADRYAARLPQWLLNFWRHNGIGSYRNGYFRLCLPHEFDNILAEIIAFFPDLQPADFAIFGYTSNSVLYVVDRANGVYWFYMNLSYIISFSADENLDSLSPGVLPGPMAASKWLDDDLKMHTRAASALGPLKKGEVYGYFPPLQLGGSPNISGLRITKAEAHWSFLAQLQPFQFRDHRTAGKAG